MADLSDVVNACSTLPVTIIDDVKLVNDDKGNGNYIRNGENVEYTSKPPMRAYASTVR